MLKSSANVIDGVKNKELYYIIFRKVPKLYLDKASDYLP